MSTDSEEISENPRRDGKSLWKRLLKILFVGVVMYFAASVLPGFRDASEKLLDVSPAHLGVGLSLEVAALFCYSLLTRAALGDEGHKISAFRLFRIQLSTRALGSTMPAGSAASSALGYRLITASGVNGPDAGFALATAGIGSAVVLNLILWLGLIVSIPLRGVNAGYGLAAVIGIILMLIAALLVFGLMEGQGRSERVVRWIAKRLRLNPDHAAEVLSHLGTRLESLARNKALLWRVVIWATLNWLFDAAALWVFLRAFGSSLAVDGLIVAFGLANVIAVVPITPGGIGIVEGVYIPTIVGFGLARTNATLGVFSYRIAQFWIPILLGGVAYLSLRMGPWSIERHVRLKKLREVAQEEAERGELNIDWVETHAPLDPTGGVAKYDQPG